MANDDKSQDTLGENPLLYPEDYPRTYKIGFGWQVLGIICSVPLIFFGITSFLDMMSNKNLLMTAGTLGLAALSTLLGLFISGFYLTKRVILHHDSLEVHHLFKKRVIRRKDIKGCRYNNQDDAAGLCFVIPTDPDAQPIGISFGMLRKDASFQEWFHDLPDLDKVEKASFETQIRHDAALGKTPEDRLLHVDNIWSKTIFFQGAFGLAFFFSIFVTTPNLAIASLFLIFPFAAVYFIHWSKNIVVFMAPRGDPHPSLELSVVFAGVFFAFWMYRIGCSLGWLEITGATILATFFLALAATFIEPRHGRPLRIAGMFINCLPYGGGLAVYCINLFQKLT